MPALMMSGKAADAGRSFLNNKSPWDAHGFTKSEGAVLYSPTACSGVRHRLQISPSPEARALGLRAAAPACTGALYVHRCRNRRDCARAKRGLMMCP